MKTVPNLSFATRRPPVRVRLAPPIVTAGHAGSDHNSDIVREAAFQQSRQHSGLATRIARTIHVSLAGLALVVLGLVVVLNHDAQADALKVADLPMAEAAKPAPHVPTAGCTATDDWPKGQIPATAQVQQFEQYDRPVTTVPFDEAWAVNHDADKANDLYVVGLCS